MLLYILHALACNWMNTMSVHPLHTFSLLYVWVSFPSGQCFMKQFIGKFHHHHDRQIFFCLVFLSYLAYGCLLLLKSWWNSDPLLDAVGPFHFTLLNRFTEGIFVYLYVAVYAWCCFYCCCCYTALMLSNAFCFLFFFLLFVPFHSIRVIYRTPKNGCVCVCSLFSYWSSLQ